MQTSNTTQTNTLVNSTFSSLFHCSESRTGVHIFFAFIVTKMLLLVPLSILIFYLGHQQWRRQRSFGTTGHPDIFTFHMAAMDLISVFGGTAIICGLYTGLSLVMIVGHHVHYMVVPAQMCIHILTCVERYLAVVHPFFFVRLRHSGGDKIQNISIVFVWLLCFGWNGVIFLFLPDLPLIPLFCVLVFSLIVVSFCSLSALCALIRPRPGEVGGDREQVDESKQRAFHTITAITGVLWLWFATLLVSKGLDHSQLLSHTDECLVFASEKWFSLPSSLVLPLLFLHRAGKLHCCPQSND